MIKITGLNVILFVIVIVLLLGVYYYWFSRGNDNNGSTIPHPISNKQQLNFEGIKEYKVDTSLVEDAFSLFTPFNGLFGSKKKKRVYDKTEKMCRRILEKHFKAEFPSARPNFLKSPVTKKNLELDCYNPDLGIALEYNGKQHYTYTPHFHKSKKDFYSQVHRDDWKRKKCKELGIKLIEVPYWITPDKLEDWILKRV